MQMKEIGLYLLALGILLLVLYGVYKVVPALQRVDPFILFSFVIMFLGTILIIISLIKEKSETKEEIKKEDLEP